MESKYPSYKYTEDDAQQQLARLVRLDNTDAYPFDNFHEHEYNEIMVFIKGGGTHNINFKNHAIKDNSIHHLAAKDLHWLERSLQSNGFAIVYKDQFLYKLQSANPGIDFFQFLGNSQVFNLDENEAQAFSFIFRELTENKTHSAYLLQVIGTFIAKISTLNPNQNDIHKINDPILPELIKLIEKKYKEEWTNKDYASHLHLSVQTLQNRIRKASGFTVSQLILNRKLKEAKKLLCSSEMQVGEIATELGFKELAHFSNWFKKNTNCAPQEYKFDE